MKWRATFTKVMRKGPLTCEQISNDTENAWKMGERMRMR